MTQTVTTVIVLTLAILGSSLAPARATDLRRVLHWPKANGNGDYGLTGMRERTEHAGGTFTVESTIGGGGTRIEASVCRRLRSPEICDT